MFTGIITDIGTIDKVEKLGNGLRLTITTQYDVKTIDIGASIAHNGICLTVTEKSPHQYKVEISDETISCTTSGNWQAGNRLNLERALKVGDELGGHIVSGHIDDKVEVLDIEPLGGNKKITFLISGLSEFIAPKGSVVINGVSLTVNDVNTTSFSVNIIPHTLENTTLNELKKGDKVNVEIDTVARYIANLYKNQL